VPTKEPSTLTLTDDHPRIAFNPTTNGTRVAVGVVVGVTDGAVGFDELHAPQAATNAPSKRSRVNGRRRMMVDKAGIAAFDIILLSVRVVRVSAFTTYYTMGLPVVLDPVREHPEKVDTMSRPMAETAKDGDPPNGLMTTSSAGNSIAIDREKPDGAAARDLDLRESSRRKWAEELGPVR
jgi:hypothetical protein